MASLASKYDPNVIIKAAEDKLATNDMAGAQMMYRSALLDWADDAREGIGLDPEQMREAIATLWIAYAGLIRNAKMHKSAFEAYEQAVSDPLARSVGRVWLEYGRFAEEREKLRTAQSVYLRALVGSGDQKSSPAVTDEQDQNLLWNEFYEMMKKRNASLTLDELKEAVRQEHLAQFQADAAVVGDDENPEQVTSAGTMMDENGDSETRPEKRQKIGDDSAVETAPSTMESKSYVVTPEAVDAEKTDVLAAIQCLPPEINAAWLIRDGDSAPTRPDPPLFSASPPKLSDPTGKGILGAELALALIQKLLKKGESDKSGTTLLEVSRGCWLMAALKEKEAANALEKLDQQMMSEMDALEANLEARLSVAGAARTAIEQMNESERNAFIGSCNRRRHQLLSGIAWEFRQLLCTQQQILTKIDVPGFEGPTVDAATIELQSRVCSLLHSAFFLRSRIGEAPHVTMLKSQAERLSSQIESNPPRSLSPPPLPTQVPPPSNVPPPLPQMYGGAGVPPFPSVPLGQPFPPQQVPAYPGGPVGIPYPPYPPPPGGQPPGNLFG